jgi:hypothetical protein
VAEPLTPERLAELRRIATREDWSPPTPEDLADLLAENDRLTAENRLFHALRDQPPGKCGRTRPHPPHRWLPSRTALDCPGIPAPYVGPTKAEATIAHAIAATVARVIAEGMPQKDVIDAMGYSRETVRREPRHPDGE